MLKRITAITLLAFVVAASLGSSSFIFACGDQQSRGGQSKEGDDHCPSPDSIVYRTSIVPILGWIADHPSDFIGAISAAVTAAATFAIAMFTIRLWQSGEKQVRIAGDIRDATEKQFAISSLQADIANKQHGLERLQFIADKRPRLRIRHVDIHHPMPEIRERAPFFIAGRHVKGDLVVANIGGTQAKIVDSRYRFYWSGTGLPMRPPLDEKTLPLFDGDIAPLEAGESRTIPITSVDAVPPEADRANYGVANWRVYLIGFIRYEDVSFPPIERFMGFCREYRLSKISGGEGRFYPIEGEPDYEYED